MDQQDEVERRLAVMGRPLRQLHDVEAIKTMHREYLRCLADRDFVRMSAFFTEDAVMDLSAHGGDRGAAEVAAHFGRMSEAPHDGLPTS